MPIGSRYLRLLSSRVRIEEIFFYNLFSPLVLYRTILYSVERFSNFFQCFWTTSTVQGVEAEEGFAGK